MIAFLCIYTYHDTLFLYLISMLYFYLFLRYVFYTYKINELLTAHRKQLKELCKVLMPSITPIIINSYGADDTVWCHWTVELIIK